jgi:hypothetical protein
LWNEMYLKLLIIGSFISLSTFFFITN